MKRIIFLLLIVTFLSANNNNVLIDASFNKDIKTVSVSIKNLSGSYIYVKDINYSLNGVRYTVNINSNIPARGRVSLPIGFNYINSGSYGLTAVLSMSSNGVSFKRSFSKILIVDNSFSFPVKSVANLIYFYKNGEIKLTLNNNNSTSIDLLLPENVVISLVATNENVLTYKLIDNNNKNIVQGKATFILNGFITNETGVVHCAESISLDYYSGNRYKKSLVGIDTIFAIIAVLIIAGMLFFVFKFYEKKDIKKAQFLFGLLVVFAVAYINFFDRYQYPSSMFWDENYYITSVEKYKQGVMFMEGHFPLGKQILAVGEIMFGGNDGLDLDSLLTTEHASSVPAGYSFLGVRFFPVLAAVIGALLLYLIFYLIFRHALYAVAFSFLYLMENAFVVHFRGAMLDSIQIAFVLGFVYIFLRQYFLIEKRKLFAYFLMGVMAGCATGVKENGAIILMLLPFLVIYENWNELKELKFSKKMFKMTGLKTLLVVFGFSVVFLGSWYLHFATGTEVYKNKTYKASAEYKVILDEKSTANPFNFKVMFRDNWKFIKEYHHGVPKYNPCKEGENGSSPLEWLLGDKSINYAWAKRDGKTYYRYLQVNPLTWGLNLAAIILSLILLGAVIFFGAPKKNKKLLYIIFVFVATYLSYMGVVLSADRVLYLYHYFIPLVLNMVLLGLVFKYSFEEFIENNDKLLMYVVIFIALEITAVFIFYSPLSYAWGLSTKQFISRVWFDVWQLKYIP